MNMNRPLARILRLRALLEEQSRLKLEKLAQQASRIERVRERERELASAGRREAFSLLTETGSRETRTSAALADETVAGEIRIGNQGPAQSPQERRILTEAIVDLAAWRERQLEPLAQTAARRVETGSEEFFLRRKERRQLETVLQDQAAQRRIEQDRRDQRELDDWFAAMRSRGRRQRPPG
jgi:hypothetical protein